MKKKIQTKETLKRELEVCRAFDISALAAAHRDLKTINDKFKGSGLIVTITDLSGNQITDPFGLTDGFSEPLIEVIRYDIAASHALRLVFNQIKK